MARTSIGSYKVTKRLEGDEEAYLVRSSKGTRAHLRLIAHPGSDVWEQARREAAICARLDHPAVGKLLDSFEDGNQLALVIEPIDGVNLEQLVDKLEHDGTKLDPLAAWFLGYQVAGALSQAHSASDEHGDLVPISHGHLAPRHIAVSFNGFVRLDGLGLSPLVASGTLPLDARYAAPEQRSAPKITPRGDIYSLAAVLWALLAGSPPPEEPSVDELGLEFPEAFRDAFARALESSLGKRRITSMELEQFLGDRNRSEGKRELAKAVAALRRGGSLPRGLAGARRSAPHPGGSRPGAGGPSASRPGASRPGGSRPGGSRPGASGPGASRPGMRKRPSAPSMRRMPNTRGRQGTLLGVPAPRKKLESRPPAMDWEAASQAAKKPSVPPGIPDDLSWGAEDDEAPTRAFDTGLAGLGASRSPTANRAPTAASSAADEKDDEDDGRLSQEEIADAIAHADRAVDALDAAPEPVASSDGDVELLEDDDDDLDLLGAAVVRPEVRESANKNKVPAAVSSDVASAAAASATVLVTESAGADDDDQRDAVTVPAPAFRAAEPEPASEAVTVPAPPKSPEPAVATAPGSETTVPETKTEPEREPSSPTTPTPWSERPPASESEPLSWAKAALIAVVSAAATMAIGIGWVRSQSIPQLPPEPPLPSATVSVAAVKPKPAPKRPAPSAKPSASASAVPAKDGKDLPANQGYLKVTFAKDDEAHVFSRSTDLGKVNELLAVDCTQAHFLRIGKGDPPKWLTEGRPGVTAKCREVTEIAMRPPLQ